MCQLLFARARLENLNRFLLKGKTHKGEFSVYLEGRAILEGLSLRLYRAAFRMTWRNRQKGCSDWRLPLGFTLRSQPQWMCTILQDKGL